MGAYSQCDKRWLPIIVTNITRVEKDKKSKSGNHLDSHWIQQKMPRGGEWGVT